MFSLGIILVLISCESFKGELDLSKEDKITPALKEVIPITSTATLNNQVYFGTDGVQKLKTSTIDLPKSGPIYSEYKVYPGISDLQLTLEERLSGVSPEKSLPPIVKYVDSSLLKTVDIDFGSLVEISTLEPLEIHKDSIHDFREIAIRRGLFSIVDGDTILPPVRILAGKPKLIKTDPPRYKYDALCNIANFNTDQNLPNSFIRSVLKDDNNIIWIGSAGGGIFTYDGEYIEQYSKEQGLPDDDIYHLIRDSKGRIWSGSFVGDLTCFDGKYFTSYGSEQGLSGDKVVSLFEDSKGNIWVGTNENLAIFDGSSFKFLNKENGLPDNIILSICETADGSFWLASVGEGAVRLKDKTLTYYNTDVGLGSNNLLSCLEDKNGNIWFTSNRGGVTMFDGSRLITYTDKQGLGSNTVLDIVEDSRGNFWFATFGNGVTMFDGEYFQSYKVENGLLDDYIRTIFVDENDFIWIGTDGLGLSILKPDNFTHLNKTSGLSNDLILAIYQDSQDRILLGGFESGLIILSKPEGSNEFSSSIVISTSHGLVDDLIVSITQDQNKDIWIGTYDGGISKIDFNSLEKGRLNITNYTTKNGLPSNYVNKVFNDSKGNLWAGTKNGPCIIESNRIVKFDSLSPIYGVEIVEIFEDNENNLWFGTMEDGVFLYSDDSLYNYSTINGLENDIGWVINQLDDGTILIGTDKGLQYLKNDNVGIINLENGLSNNQVYSIVKISDSIIWLGTTKGLNYVELNKQKDSDLLIPSITPYNKTDGLISDDFYHNSALKDNEGHFWFGTLKGLTRLHLNTFQVRPDIPIALIKDVRINKKVVDYRALLDSKRSGFDKLKVAGVEAFSNIPTGLELPYSSNHLTIYFSGTEWLAPNKVLSMYMLEGLDDQWSTAMKNNIADYRNLSPGRYTFKVKSINSSGIEGEETVFKFRVLSPWYRSWLAMFVYFIIAFFIVYLIVKWRVSRLQKQKLLLEHKVSDRTQKLDKALILANQAADAKSHFIATISHELRTPLNAIIGLTHMAQKNTVDRKQEDYLKKIDRSSDTLLKLINEILDFSKIEAGKMKLEEVEFNFSTVIDTVIELNAQSALDKGLEFVINVDPEIPQNLVGDPLRISQIITNLCNNAIKFTDKGEVVVSVNLEEEKKSGVFIEVSVKDTGIGISDEQIPTLFEEFKQADASITRKYGGTGLGLSICRLFIEMMDGQIWLESEVGKGTTFSFDFKLSVMDNNLKKVGNVSTKLSDKEILICDNNKEALKCLADILTYNSLNFDTADSGKETLHKINDKEYDLLIIDYNMDDMNGLDVILKLRSDHRIAKLKTILVTDLNSGLESFERNIIGIDGYLIKPVLSSQLLHRIYSLFGIVDDTYSGDGAEKSSDEIYIKKLSGKQVLLAEDNELNRQVLIELSEAVGMIVDIAKNGSVALQKALEKRYDLIFMDLHMPVMDGFNSTMQIRSNDIDTPIVAITADAMHTVKKECDDAGIDEIITKPIDPDSLYKVIDRLIYGTDSGGNITESSISVISLLDIEAGIRRLGGDKDLYFKMLNKFVSSAGEICDKIMSLTQSSDTEKAFLLAHSLKGESGNLGAERVSELARELEKAVKESNVELIESLSKKINERIVQITQQLQSTESDKSDVTLTEFRPLDSIVNELIDCLQNSNPKVFDLIDELEEKTTDHEILSQLNKKIRDGDTKESIHILRNIIKKT